MKKNIVPFGAYVHWPFCAAKCPYCDFNSHVARQEIDETRFLQAYRAEIGHWAGLMEAGYVAGGDQRRLSSIFFGGGTPSLMSPVLVEGILSCLEERFGFDDDIEISLEANPQSVDAANFKDLRSIGINRLSIGVQSFKDADLKTLGRLHDSAQARRAIEIARTHFDRFSFDLIYGRPHQTLADWEAEMGEAFALEPTHLSLYQLTIEPNTPYKKLYDAGKILMPDEDLAVDFYELTQTLCVAQGLPAYEVSNHAVPGQEARHNVLYWRYGDFLGIGAGAHGRLTIGKSRFATMAAQLPTDWLKKAEQNGHGGVVFDEIDQESQATEMVLMGMRLKAGFSLVDLEERTGFLVAGETVDELVEDGLLLPLSDGLAGGEMVRQGQNSVFLRPTDKGLQLLNYVAGRMVEGLVRAS